MKSFTSSRSIILICVSLILIALAFLIYKRPSGASHYKFDKGIALNPTPTPDPLKPLNIAIIGYAGPGHDGGSLTDTIILAHIDPKLKQTHLISVPRDTWISLPTSTESSSSAKINTAFAIGNDDARYPNKPEEFQGKNGGGNLLKYALSTLTGIEPDYYIAINFQGFVDSINLLGGVTIDVPYTFDDYFYPIAGKETETCGKSEEDIANLTATMAAHLLEKEFPCRYEHIHFTAGPTTMTAQEALKFVRSRHSLTGGGDFGRSQRQQALITALKDKVFSVQTLTKSIPLMQQASDFVKTDLNLKAAKEFITTFDQAPSYPLKSITLSTANVFTETKSFDGQYILVPTTNPNDFSSIHQFIADNLASPSANLKN
jgi:anionic cell wall polymer biosynthesis LytR-Cps2A-Psr (LCP) family protein